MSSVTLVTSFVSLVCLSPLHSVERVTCPTTAILTHSGPACAIQKLHVTFHESLSHLRGLRLDDLVFFTLVAELSSSAMSGATDRREDEQVPQFYGRIDEKFAEWETDVRLWQVEFKVEDRDRLGPRLYRRGLHGQPKTIVKTKLGTQDVAQFTVDNIIQCLKDNGCGELPEELGQEALDNYFDM